MKTKQKELLVRARPELLRSLEVTAVLPALRESGHFNSKEEQAVTSESARRRRVTKLLDLLEKKKTEAFDVFVDALEEQYTHLYLQLTGFETNYDSYTTADFDDTDEWANFRRARAYLIEEIDAMKVAPGLLEKEIINEEEFKEIRTAGDTERKTECLLDILETKSQTAVEIVIDVIGDSYPHLYLILSGDNALEDDDDLL